MQRTQQIAEQEAARERDYAAQERARTEARMSGVQALGERALQKVSAFDQGKDVGRIYAPMATLLGQGADQFKAIGRMPTALGKDPRYAARLQRQAQGQISTELGRNLAEGAYAQRAADVQEAANAIGMAQAGGQQALGTFQQTMGSAGQLFSQAANMRQQAMQRSQQAFNNVMAGINTAIGAVSAGSGVFSAKALGKIANKP